MSLGMWACNSYEETIDGCGEGQAGKCGRPFFCDSPYGGRPPASSPTSILDLRVHTDGQRWGPVEGQGSLVVRSDPLPPSYTYQPLSVLFPPKTAAFSRDFWSWSNKAKKQASLLGARSALRCPSLSSVSLDTPCLSLAGIMDLAPRHRKCGSRLSTAAAVGGPREKHMLCYLRRY